MSVQRSEICPMAEESKALAHNTCTAEIDYIGSLPGDYWSLKLAISISLRICAGGSRSAKRLVW